MIESVTHHTLCHSIQSPPHIKLYIRSHGILLFSSPTLTTNNTQTVASNSDILLNWTQMSNRLSAGCKRVPRGMSISDHIRWNCCIYNIKHSYSHRKFAFNFSTLKVRG